VILVSTEVAIIGGGRMGRGIAHAFLVKGISVLLVDLAQNALQAAEIAIKQSVIKSAQRDQDLDTEQTLSLLHFSTGISDIAECGLVIEAVPEDFPLKVRVLEAIDSCISSTAILATNTSSFSIRELAISRKYPENFLGLHFFNPVPSSLLVEIVFTAQIQPKTLLLAAGWVTKIGKTPLQIADSPGFASSRLGIILGLEAMRMLEEGVATAADIDAAMMLGYKHPVGPLKLTDIVGLDVRLGIAKYLEENLGPRFTPPKILIDLVAAGSLGRKSGKGFYEWAVEVEK
jgi:3-hydroxybutyryl-CoA dehydrogenase